MNKNKEGKMIDKTKMLNIFTCNFCGYVFKKKDSFVSFYDTEKNIFNSFCSKCVATKSWQLKK